MPISPLPLTATFVSVFLLFNLLTFTPSFAWYDKGHLIVALIAEANLTAEARKRIEEILPGNMTFADAAIWQDHEGRGIRDLDSLHYVNIPEDASGYDHERYVPESNCTAGALQWFLAVRADSTGPISI